MRTIATTLFTFCLLAHSCASTTPTTASTTQDPRQFVSSLETEPIPYEVVYKIDRSLPPGRVQKMRNGVDGTLLKMVLFEYRDGQLVDTKVLWEKRQEPVDAVFNMGEGGHQTTRGSFTRQRVLVMEATAYSHQETSNRTATGVFPGYGVVAVDPSVIKLGTRVFVEGYGLAVAADTGGAIKGNRIDLAFQTRAEALRFGRKRVRVHILE